MKNVYALILFLVLLPLAAAFAVTPAATEFASGNRKKFHTADHPKSKGLKMVLSYPNSWLAEEGDRPNVVQKFFSEGGVG